MKVLILSCNTGEGHNSAAAAVAERLESRGDTCVIKDALAYVSERFSKFICNWHTRIYRNVPVFFNIGYKLVDKSQNGKGGSVFGPILNTGAEKLAKEINDGGYDWVICTHAFSAYMFTTTVKRYGVQTKSGFIATDYTCSPPVDKTLLDVYFVPHEQIKSDFIAKKIPAEKLVAAGLPIRSEFYKRYTKSASKRALGLPEDKANILLMCGSMGCGPLKETACRLAKIVPDNVFVTVICGNNRKLKAELKRLNFSKDSVRIVGYTKNIHHYMDSADLIISKAGGITCTESMVKRLPMLLINAVEGCEVYNRMFYTSNGGAVETDGPVADFAIKLINNPALLQRMSFSMGLVYPGNAAENICNYLHGQN